MRGVVLDFVGLLLLGWGIQIVVGAAFGTLWAWEVRLRDAIVRRVRPEPPATVMPLRRPVEQVAADVRRLRAAFRRDGLRFAKWEGTRLAYDAALSEAADTLEITHLLALLPPGVERDNERARVERLLEQTGLLPSSDAA
jgi:hypothetical protein